MSTYTAVVEEARELEASFKAGQLSKDKYVELLEDLKRTKAITAAAGDLKLKAEINEIINGLIVVAGAI